MARYYVEKKNGKVKHVVVQTNEGVFDSVSKNQAMQIYEPKIVEIPTKTGSKFVGTVEEEFLEFHRTIERSDFMDSIPTEIQEKTGSLVEIINYAWDSGGV